MSWSPRRNIMRWPALLILAVAAFLIGCTGSAVLAETYQFKTEVARVMDILIHSVYKSKEIFLRELISNASDAVDKLRFLAVTDKHLLESNPHLNITIDYDLDNRMLTITDSGIGMNQHELMNNLGTIAKSGTADFIEEIKADQGSSDLIGKFGVGFYSVFLVADKVQVISRRCNETAQYIWESSDASAFDIYEDTKGPFLSRGTSIRLHIKPENTEFLDSNRLKELVRKYSEFVDFPIYVSRLETITEKVPIKKENVVPPEDAVDKIDGETENVKDKEENQEDKGESVDGDNDDDLKVEDVTEEPETTTIEKEVKVWDHVNTNKPIWMRSPSEVSEEDYNEFYKSYFRQWENPFKYVHFRGEGTMNFRALMYIPLRPPMDMVQPNPEKSLRNIKLFVRRVFITDELLDFMPPWLSFVRGIIDSDDFPLNVSRETVQKTRLLGAIKNKVVSKVIQTLNIMSKNQTEYEGFYKEFSTSIKMGIMSDARNKKKLLRLLRFHTTGKLENNEQLTSLDDYVSRMRKDQKGIYVLTGTDLDQMRKSPYLEALSARGYEILLMDDQYDEYLLPSVLEYDDIKLIHINKGKLEFGDEEESEKEAEKKLADEYQPLTTWLTELFKEHVEKTVVSNRLTTSAVALVAPETGVSGYMRQILSAQQRSMDPVQRAQLEMAMRAKQTLEINPHHPILKVLLSRVEDDKADNDETRDLARSLLDLALIRGGYPLGDADSVSRRIETAVRLGLMVDLEARPEVNIKQAPEVDPDVAAKLKERREKELDDEKEVEDNIEEHEEL